MNYLKELNAFYDQQETNPLSGSAIAIWHALMHICNKAGWPKNFSVAVSVVCIKAGVKERSFYNARNELKQKGYIDFSSRRGNQAAVYVLYTRAVTYAHSFADSNAESTAGNLGGNVSPLIKHKQTIQNETSINCFQFFEKNGFGMLSPFISDSMNSWLTNTSFEEPEEVVIEAMKIALLQNVRNWKYVSRILQDWETKRLFTLDAIQAEQDKRNKRVTPFPKQSKGGVSRDTSKRSSAAGDKGYDFGF
ncbi:DnaD/phage-associated family protein [Sinobaca qinghaiensis]|uniref:DnaD/phage-associated family protein n=1 Tax=Sinobaca qinghaiensis TaxID=342944 RepID=A0A419V0B9_9BACL|nr:DnaD domain protein [Sinobaca qinghaiensis]RKD71404.1 DnaD/phage-associated family protein [Sinobaca qinghaiensis]